MSCLAISVWSFVPGVWTVNHESKSVCTATIMISAEEFHNESDNAS